MFVQNLKTAKEGACICLLNDHFNGMVPKILPLVLAKFVHSVMDEKAGPLKTQET